MAASAGTEAYTETDSPAAGLIAAGTAGLMPAAGNIARQAALKGMGAELAEGALLKGGGATVDEMLAKLNQGAVPRMISERVPTTFGQAAGAWGAEQLCMAVGEAHLAGDLYSGKSWTMWVISHRRSSCSIYVIRHRLPRVGIQARIGRVWWGSGTQAHRRNQDEYRADGEGA